MINLLPPNVRREYQAARRNTIMRRYAVLIVIVLVLCAEIVGYGWLSINAASSQAQVAQSISQTQVDSMKDTADTAKSVSANITTIGRILDQKISFSDMITGMGKVTPPKALLSSLQLDVQATDKEPITLKFMVDSAQTAAILRNNLSSSDLFDSINIQTVEERGQTDNPSDMSKRYPFIATLNAELKYKTAKDKQP